MLHLDQLTYSHPNCPVLLKDLNLSLPPGLTGVVGANGSGKSTLLQLIAGKLQPTLGKITCQEPLHYVPQHYGQFDQLTVAEVLEIQPALQALYEILNGNTSPHNFEILADQWDLEERLIIALNKWGLKSGNITAQGQVAPGTFLSKLSGGMKTKVLLSGLSLHNPSFILLDEPTNHLDLESRSRLYDYLQGFSGTALIVTHDRALLDRMQHILQLDNQGLTLYGGNYDFFLMEQAKHEAALERQLSTKSQILKAAERTQRQALERKQKQDSRGKQKQQKAGLPTILQHSLQGKAENSRADLLESHHKKLSGIKADLSELRNQQRRKEAMRFEVEDSKRPIGKILLEATDLNFSYPNHSKPIPGQRPIWSIPLTFKIPSGIRCIIEGKNGSGKSTLFALIAEKLQPDQGHFRYWNSQDKQIGKPQPLTILTLDQDYTLINNNLTIFEQAMSYKSPECLPSEVGIILTRFLFTVDYWDRRCLNLSGGERMRLALCTLQLRKQAPDILILDEPTNNLDLAHLEILTTAIKSYKGTLLVSSHDIQFLEEINMTDRLLINEGGKIVPFAS
ncbi:ATPase components of ABC transporters with duplicated ATPase domains [Arachidicoccus rhizosphaerae]|uniref:ATPase components of ABC transporters with duplicated ATPase domains n=1 Tax=Arachidicoccus rhizosphaerae TaxID=551991 RepID=A0A1H4BDQ5_9BACT|nr:ABC-F family ATP-binding cassette domain-containing protein [Arachidicoccus rhizosphaerae]SEA46293.1 ATPase components of ABC transporters with duplicated ATPase domains [Arachidicoccus rhizosphaerae]